MRAGPVLVALLAVAEVAAAQAPLLPWATAPTTVADSTKPDTSWGQVPTAPAPGSLVLNYEQVAKYCKAIVSRTSADSTSAPFRLCRMTPLDPSWATFDPPTPEQLKTATGSFGPANAKGPESPGATPGSLETTILYGLTDFLVQRFEEDLSEYGLHVLVGRICATGSSSAQALVHTCHVLAIADSTNYRVLVANLRAAASKDVTNAPTTIVVWLVRAHYDTSTHKGEGSFEYAINFSKQADRGVGPEVAGTVLFGASLWDGWSKGLPPLQAIANWTSVFAPNLWGISCTHMKVSTALYQGATLIQALANGPALPTSKPARDSAVDNAFRATVANIAGHAIPIWDDKKCGPLASMAFAGARLAVVAERLKGALDQFATLGASVSDSSVKTPAAHRERERAYTAAVINASLDLADLLVTVPYAVTPDSALSLSRSVLTSVRQAGSDIGTGQYAAALVEVSDLVGTVDTSFPKATDPTNKWRTVLAPLAIAAEFAQADSAGAVVSVLNQVAAPRHSFLKKQVRGGGSYTTLQAYGGGMLGIEHGLNGVEKCCAKVLAPMLSVGAEIGASFNNKLFSSFGVYFSMLDLGALASYRITNASAKVSSAPTVGLAQVFAPGIAVRTSFTGTPITLGVMAGWTPRLRSVQSSGSSTTDASTFRLGLFLGMDMPLL